MQLYGPLDIHILDKVKHETCQQSVMGLTLIFIKVLQGFFLLFLLTELCSFLNLLRFHYMSQRLSMDNSCYRIEPHGIDRWIRNGMGMDWFTHHFSRSRVEMQWNQKEALK